MPWRSYYDDEYVWYPRTSLAERRNKAAREAARLTEEGHTLQPVVIDGSRIANTFWGKAWCRNLGRYSDYANRLPRGRSYARNGSVIDLRVASCAVAALVSGSHVYEVEVKIAAIPRERWKEICMDCAGAIDSVIELLRGQFSKSVMTRVCQENTGLFPSASEIEFRCSCPDSARMCKHVAAVLYGIGARLDEKPELLFTLRNVDKQDLISHAGEGMANKTKGPTAGKVLENDNLSEIFGIEITHAPPRRGAKRRSRL